MSNSRRYRAIAVGAMIVFGAFIQPAMGQVKPAPRSYPYVPCRATLDRIHLVSRSAVVYGLAIRTEPKITAVRVFINTEKRSYSVTFTDLAVAKPPGSLRFVSLADPTQVESAWIDRAGSNSDMKGCSRPSPSPDDDGAAIAMRETVATDALNHDYTPATPVVAATDVTDEPPEERCFQPSMPPRVIRAATPSTGGVTYGQRGVVDVLVYTNAQSEQTFVDVYRSSRSAALDASAVQAAWQSRFLTESVECRPVSANYRFVVDFS